MCERRECEGIGNVKREKSGDCSGEKSQRNYAICERGHDAATAEAAGG